MIAVLVLGPPAAGKTTAVRAVTRSREIAHFKVREHLAHLLATEDPVAVAHRTQVLRRDVLPDAVVRHAFADFLRTHRDATAVLVEGYPRSAAQLADLRHALAAHHGRLAGAVLFDAPDAVLHTRGTRRVACPRCDRSGVRDHDTTCPRCALALITRPDDTPDRFAARLAHYRTTTTAITRLLAGTDRIVLDAALAPDTLATHLRTALHRLDHRQQTRPPPLHPRNDSPTAADTSPPPGEPGLRPPRHPPRPPSARTATDHRPEPAHPPIPGGAT